MPLLPALQKTHSGIGQWVELAAGAPCLSLSSTSSICIYGCEASLIHPVDSLLNVGGMWGKTGREGVEGNETVYKRTVQRKEERVRLDDIPQLAEMTRYVD